MFFSFAGIGMVWVLVSAGIFLVRLAGYTVCSNVMNRKRMVVLRDCLWKERRSAAVFASSFKS